MGGGREGFPYVRAPVLQSTFVIDLIAMIFGMPRALFPVLVVEQFHDGRRWWVCCSPRPPSGRSWAR